MHSKSSSRVNAQEAQGRIVGGLALARKYATRAPYRLTAAGRGWHEGLAFREKEESMLDYSTKHRVLAEFDHEQKDGWVSVNKSFDKAKDAHEFMNECMRDVTCIRAQLLIVRLYKRA